MNAFEEFAQLARHLEKDQIPYALVGGVALAFHGHARFTRDVDILLQSESLPALASILKELGYRSFAPPWELGTSGIHLHRWLKPRPDEELILDILEARTESWSQIVDRALVSEGPEGRVRVARREDLIALKRLRNSKQDEADIERLDAGT